MVAIDFCTQIKMILVKLFWADKAISKKSFVYLRCKTGFPQIEMLNSKASKKIKTSNKNRKKAFVVCKEEKTWNKLFWKETVRFRQWENSPLFRLVLVPKSVSICRPDRYNSKTLNYLGPVKNPGTGHQQLQLSRSNFLSSLTLTFIYLWILRREKVLITRQKIITAGWKSAMELTGH